MKIVVLIVAVAAIGFSVYQHVTSAPPAEETPGNKAETQAIVDEAKSKTQKMINDLRYGKEKPDQQVTCDIGGTTRFMMESDCLTQGGSVR